MTTDLSSLRSQLLARHDQLGALLQDFLGRQPLLPASLYTLRRRCGKPSCRCTRGQLHVSTVLSYRGQGRPQNVSPPAEHLDAVRLLADDYRRFRKARSQLLGLQRQCLALIDRLEAARVQQGERQFRKLCPTVSPTRSRR